MEESVDSRWKQWLKEQWECLFMDETNRLLRYRFKRRPKQVEKHISMLESIKNNESDYFWRDVCRSNLLAYLYLHPTVLKLTEASKLIQRSQQSEPTSLAALVNQFQLLKLQKMYEQAGEVLNELNDLDSRRDSNVLRLVAIAEVAYCMEFVGPDFYLDSIRKYEKVLEEIDKLTEQEKEHKLIKKKLCFWKFQLAQTYARLMTRGNVELLSGEYKVDVAFRKCSKLLMEVIEIRDHFYHGRALVELIDLYNKNEFCGMVGNAVFPYKGNHRECMDEAYEISRDEDPYVLERCGRYYRQKASTEEEYLFAIEALEEAVKLCPTRHMAWNQMGLVYKHMCALFMKDSRRKSRNDYRQQNRSCGGNANAERLGKTSNLGSKDKTAMHSHYSQMARNTSEFQPKQTFCDKVKEYSEKAIECFEKASGLMGDASCRYLVDLAKCYIFRKRLPEAENCYRLAADTEDCVHNDNDAAYLYENWAEKWNKNRDNDAGTWDDIKNMYREAIKRSIRGNFTCGKLAFCNLRGILKEELHNSNDEALKLESSVLLSEVKSFSTQENIFVALLDALRNNPVKVVNAWKLVELYHRRNRQYDASAACTYLTALDKAGQLRLDEEDFKDISIQRKIIITDLATRAAEESDTGVIAKLRGTPKLGSSDQSVNDGSSHLDNIYPHSDLKYAFRWLAGDKTFLERGFQSSNDDTINSKYNSTDICLIAWDDIRRSDSEDTTAITRFRKLLEAWCAMGDGVCCFPDDIYFDQPFSQAATAMLSKTKAVAVILRKGVTETDTKSDLSGAIFDVLRHLNQLNLPSNICFVVEEDFQFEGLSQFAWPYFQASLDFSNSCMISSFFKVLFRTSTKI